MHIRDILASDETTFSFEYFPPKSTKAAETLYQTISDLQQYDPAFVSVTYGAGGTTRGATYELVLRLLRETNVNTIPHLTCVGHSKRDIEVLLEKYAEAGVGNILALRGDLPKNGPGTGSEAFPHATDLVAFIRHFSEQHGYDFGIGVAGFPEGHPETPNRMQELNYLKAKVDAGADYICTQLFFENTDFYDFRDRCELVGIDVPILAGIMPVSSLSGLNRMAELAGGARVPAKLLRALSRARGDSDCIRHVGVHYATTQCSDLIGQGVKGIHFYTLNQSTATLEIFRGLGKKIES
jgi:methylenetetrahydrofolate reductase (NADPH)